MNWDFGTDMHMLPCVTRWVRVRVRAEGDQQEEICVYT